MATDATAAIALSMPSGPPSRSLIHSDESSVVGETRRRPYCVPAKRRTRIEREDTDDLRVDEQLVRGVSVALVLTLAACGGGGGGSSSTSSAPGAPASSTSPPLAPADLVVTAFSAPSSGTAGQTYTVTGTITNQRDGSGLASAVVFIAPLDNVRNLDMDLGMVGLAVNVNFLAPGQSWSFSSTPGADQRC